MTPSRQSIDALRLILVGLLCQAVLSCAASVTPASAAPPSSRMSPAEGAAAIGAIVREEIAAGHLPGAVVVVGVDDKVVLRQAYGERAVLPGRSPATVDTIYDAASLTKVMATAVAIQQLAERGKIDLDKPAATYWPAVQMKVEKDYGSLSAGKYADIIAVDADPLKDVTVLEHVAFVMKGGVVYKAKGMAVSK